MRTFLRDSVWSSLTIITLALSLLDAASAYGQSTAQFLKQDSTTSGNWIGVYGNDGYVFPGMASNPYYAQINVNGSQYNWASPTTNPGGYQTVSNPSVKYAECFYTNPNLSIDINLTDGNTHQIALYMFDFDNVGRNSNVSVVDASSGAVLDTENVNSYAGGKYLIWNIQGHVTFNFAVVGGVNATVSGILFDPPASIAQSTSCQIINPACPAQPGYPQSVGTVYDTYQDAGYSVPANANQAECLQRAQEYQSWCGETQAVTANYIVNGSVVATATAPALAPVNQPTSSCASAGSSLGGTPEDCGIAPSVTSLLSSTYLTFYPAVAPYNDHQTGYAVANNAWATDVTQPVAFLTYGPYTNQVVVGHNVAAFTLMIDNNSADNGDILTLDVTANTGQTELGTLEVHRQDFTAPMTPQVFIVPFDNTGFSDIEFRVNWHGGAYIQHLMTQIETSANLVPSNTGSTSQSPGSATSSPAPQANNQSSYVGCFTDDSGRALPNELAGSGATVESCIALAQAQGFTYAGVQYGGQCFAGNAAGYSQVADSQCNMPCDSNQNEICGGSWLNSIYATSVSSSSSRTPSSMTSASIAVNVALPSAPPGALGNVISVTDPTSGNTLNFVVGSDHSLYDSINGGAWTSLGGYLQVLPDTGTNQSGSGISAAIGDGEVVIAAIGSDNAAWIDTLSTEGTVLQNWTSLGGSFSSSPAINSDGSIDGVSSTDNELGTITSSGVVYDNPDASPSTSQQEGIPILAVGGATGVAFDNSSSQALTDFVYQDAGAGDASASLSEILNGAANADNIIVNTTNKVIINNGTSYNSFYRTVVDLTDPETARVVDKINEAGQYAVSVALEKGVTDDAGKALAWYQGASRYLTTYYAADSDASVIQRTTQIKQAINVFWDNSTQINVTQSPIDGVVQDIAICSDACPLVQAAALKAGYSPTIQSVVDANGIPHQRLVDSANNVIANANWGEEGVFFSDEEPANLAPQSVGNSAETDIYSTTSATSSGNRIPAQTIEAADSTPAAESLQNQLAESLATDSVDGSGTASAAGQILAQNPDTGEDLANAFSKIANSNPGYVEQIGNATKTFLESNPPVANALDVGSSVLKYGGDSLLFFQIFNQAVEDVYQLGGGNTPSFSLGTTIAIGQIPDGIEPGESLINVTIQTGPLPLCGESVCNPRFSNAPYAGIPGDTNATAQNGLVYSIDPTSGVTTVANVQGVVQFIETPYISAQGNIVGIEDQNGNFQPVYTLTDASGNQTGYGCFATGQFQSLDNYISAGLVAVNVGGNTWAQTTVNSQGQIVWGDTNTVVSKSGPTTQISTTDPSYSTTLTDPNGNPTGVAVSDSGSGDSGSGDSSSTAVGNNNVTDTNSSSTPTVTNGASVTAAQNAPPPSVVPTGFENATDYYVNGDWIFVNSDGTVAVVDSNNNLTELSNATFQTDSSGNVDQIVGYNTSSTTTYSIPSQGSMSYNFNASTGDVVQTITDSNGNVLETIVDGVVQQMTTNSSGQTVAANGSANGSNPYDASNPETGGAANNSPVGGSTENAPPSSQDPFNSLISSGEQQQNDSDAQNQAAAAAAAAQAAANATDPTVAQNAAGIAQAAAQQAMADAAASGDSAAEASAQQAEAAAQAASQSATQVQAQVDADETAEEAASEAAAAAAAEQAAEAAAAEEAAEQAAAAQQAADQAAEAQVNTDLQNANSALAEAQSDNSEAASDPDPADQALDYADAANAAGVAAAAAADAQNVASTSSDPTAAAIAQQVVATASQVQDSAGLPDQGSPAADIGFDDTDYSDLENSAISDEDNEIADYSDGIDPFEEWGGADTGEM